MYSKILVKLVDEAVIPALLLLTTRVLSVVFIARLNNIPFEIGASGFVFANPEQFVFVNSYSIAAMVVVLTIGLLYVLLKAYIFHDSHISPHNTAKLFSMRLSTFIQSSFDVYSQGVIWLSYGYLMLFVSALLVVFGLIYTWVFFVALVMSIISTVLFVFDIEREIFEKYEMHTDAAYKEEEYILTLGSLE